MLYDEVANDLLAMKPLLAETPSEALELELVGYGPEGIPLKVDADSGGTAVVSLPPLPSVVMLKS